MQPVSPFESWLFFLGAAAFGTLFTHWPEWLSHSGEPDESAGVHPGVGNSDQEPETAEDDPSAESTAEPVQSFLDEMLSQSRYAILLRPQLVENLTPEQLERTRTAFTDAMCLVPEGDVLIRPERPFTAEAEGLHAGKTLHLAPYFLDRFPVTNAQYRHFVAAGGYEHMDIWDREIWPAVLDFVDRTGHPGPRYWREGKFSRGEGNQPVVGVSWYEAAAYARWVGKRLATDAEWVKAASWPVSIPGHPLLQRKYPWGESMDRSRANVWGSGPGRPVNVDEFSAGASVAGIQQLIGNVWEWTADPLPIDQSQLQPGDKTNLKTLRGGAFDTYFHNQATCHFQSADWAMARKHNIGFRVAISLSDLSPGDSPSSSKSEDEA
ncbi:MAG TPA: SUMF1/EgtB/PvdO family nonheme iron enzyme [Pirellulales bacterium]|jgi:iron(II)-dependent oxidoreductase|nr:SUMF1/EgtB/PvdO family nonheme iron enzyme [Pirellulales bacterium]